MQQQLIAEPPRVLNKRHLNGRTPPNAVYVGRPSKWGNPWRIGKGYPRVLSRDEAVRRYKDYIYGAMSSGALDPTELRGKDLVCWCAPLPCHADYLLYLANRE